MLEAKVDAIRLQFLNVVSNDTHLKLQIPEGSSKQSQPSLFVNGVTWLHLCLMVLRTQLIRNICQILAGGMACLSLR